MKRPATLIIAAGLVILMVFISAVWPMVSGNRFSNQSLMKNDNFQPMQRSFNRGNPPQGTPPAFLTNGDQKMNENGTGSNPGASTSVPETPGQRNPGSGLNPGWVKIFSCIFYVVILVLGLIAAGGLWMGRRWGNVISIIVSAFVVVTTLPSLFTNVSEIDLVQFLLKIFLAIGIVVLVLLPVSKVENVPLEN